MADDLGVHHVGDVDPVQLHLRRWGGRLVRGGGVTHAMLMEPSSKPPTPTTVGLDVGQTADVVGATTTATAGGVASRRRGAAATRVVAATATAAAMRAGGGPAADDLRHRAPRCRRRCRGSRCPRWTCHRCRPGSAYHRLRPRWVRARRCPGDPSAPLLPPPLPPSPPSPDRHHHHRRHTLKDPVRELTRIQVAPPPPSPPFSPWWPSPPQRHPRSRRGRHWNHSMGGLPHRRSSTAPRSSLTKMSPIDPARLSPATTPSSRHR